MCFGMPEMFASATDLVLITRFVLGGWSGNDEFCLFAIARAIVGENLPSL